MLPNFAGTVHHALPLRTPHQFCLFERNLTIFSGVQVRLPLCRPQKAEQPPQPGFVSIVVPSWITVQPVTNLTCVSCRIRTSPALNSSETLPGGLTRLTFASLGNNQRPENPAKPNPKYVHGYLPGHWTTYNNFVPLYLTFPEGHDGETVDVSVLIHWTPGKLRPSIVCVTFRCCVICIMRLSRIVLSSQYGHIVCIVVCVTSREFVCNLFKRRRTSRPSPVDLQGKARRCPSKSGSVSSCSASPPRSSPHFQSGW